MARMIFDLTDDDREALDRLRAARGLRSNAEALRALIRENTEGGEITLGVVKTPRSDKTVDLGVGGKPQAPIRGKTVVRRLKGEWKAP